MQLSQYTTVATYTYDAWGNPLGTVPTTGIAALNPLRYRGYVYDPETELYYLQSRYYNPQIGRFLNADGFVSTGQGILGHNMFAYCGNNPVNMIDPTGTRHEIYSGGGFGTTTDVQSIRFSDIFGYGTSLSQNYDIISAETFFFDSESGYSTSKVISGDISKPISFYCENASDWWNVNEYKAGIKFNTKSGGFSIAEGPGETSVVIAYDQKSLEILVGLNKMGYTVRDDVDFGSGTAGFYHHGYIRTIPTVGAAAVVAALIFTASGLPAALAFA